jgi:hypothetical protein
MSTDDEPNPFHKPAPYLSGCVVPAFAIALAAAVCLIIILKCLHPFDFPF